MIDHIFVLVETDGPEIHYLASLGLVETYRRNHSGQGTQSVCYCFDNLFLELLWVNDPDAARSDAVKRSGLYERSMWRTNGTCPFGIAWRPSQADPKFTPPTWEFKPPYLPNGMSIAVAKDSDDQRQPVMFESPGSLPPIEWPIERRKSLQHDTGLGAVTEIRLTMPADAPPTSTLIFIAQSEAPPLRITSSGSYRISLQIASLLSKPGLQIALPLSS